MAMSREPHHSETVEFAELRGDEQLAQAPVYYPVRVWKFLALSLLTFSIYECYWMYWNWRYVRERDGTVVTPLARAIFAPIFFPTLLIDLRKHSSGWATSLFSIAICSILYAVTPFVWRQPDPYCLLGYTSTLAMLPAVLHVNALNHAQPEALARSSSWKLRHTLLAVVGLPLLCLNVGITVFLIPGAEVVVGERLWDHQRAYLERAGVVAQDEKIDYFYSNAVFSIAHDGNLLTDRGVISYWRDEDSNDFFVERATFDNIAEVAPVNDETGDITRVTVTLWDDSEFELWLPNSGPGVSDFLETLSVRRGLTED